ncbi:MAG: hypothetical protein LBU00_02040 [Treponema sp.]|jgi:hypothetical protein|nr:hypothetical protein [Treponema sp.]
MPVNREYKSSVFSLLFSDPELLRELYGAIAGISLPPDLPITINTLQYIGRVYEKLTAGLKAFGRKLIKIPRPEFIVLYNGVDPYPDESILNLSDAFEDVSEVMNMLFNDQATLTQLAAQ